jgi:hypothetical protein
VEAGPFRSVDEIAVAEHGGADADRHAVHRRDDRLGGVADRLEETERRPVLALRRVREEVVQVVAGGEAIAGAVEQHDAHRPVRVRRHDRVGETGIHRGRDRVLLVGPVQLDALHRAFADSDDVGHAGLLDGWTAAGS